MGRKEKMEVKSKSSHVAMAHVEDRELVAAGPAAFSTHTKVASESSHPSSQISSCSEASGRERLAKEMDNEAEDDDITTARVSGASTTAINTACREQQSFSYRQVMFHLGIVFLLLFSLSAQHCSSEVVRLRHPEHLYYGDRGGGGPAPYSSHRHNSIISMNMNNEEYLMEGMSPKSIGLDADEESRQSPPPLAHHRSRNVNVFSSIHNKRKSHGINDNFNSNNSYNGSGSGTEKNNSGGGSSSKRSYNGFTIYEPYQRGGNTLPQHDTTEALAASEDRELPVYFARQGNDGVQEVDQLDPTVGGSTSEAPVVEENGKLFPPDLFTLEQRQQGAVVFYIAGVLYMFVALAIVCDEFFVPSLDVIIEFLAIQDDVAGATFMAAGGSAPELFTSVIGVFISKDDVGIGTIVGSAVFNILFVIGMCAIFSKTVLHLTWWPLFRDCSFYSVALITLIIFFRDSLIYWWEALSLFCIYICYVTFMKFNASFERALKKLLFKNRVTRVSSTDQLVNNKSVNNGASSSQTSVQTVSGNQSSRGSATMKPPLSAQGRRNSIPMLHSGSKFRHGLLQLMIQSIDPLHDGRVDEKATQLHAIASLKALLDAAKTEADTTVTNNSRSKPVSPPQVPPSVQPADAPLTTVDIEDQANGDAPTVQELAALQEAADEGHEPLDISWPKGSCKKQISYVLLFPIMIMLYLTLPDTRTPRGKKFFYWGFLGSILWIAVFSYFMVWWADRTGETFGIAPEIMGLTFLAAGTSIPDLITSVIVARKGLGDMAVSSSVGSNIFDVCVGLPVPWLLYGIWKGEPVEVSAKGMLCSISILFGMLCFVVLSIMLFRWKMNKGLGLVMFILYFIFLGVSLLFEYNVITCPRFLEA